MQRRLIASEAAPPGHTPAFSLAAQQEGESTSKGDAPARTTASHSHGTANQSAVAGDGGLRAAHRASSSGGSSLGSWQDGGALASPPPEPQGTTATAADGEADEADTNSTSHASPEPDAVANSASPAGTQRTAGAGSPSVHPDAVLPLVRYLAAQRGQRAAALQLLLLAALLEASDASEDGFPEACMGSIVGALRTALQPCRTAASSWPYNSIAASCWSQLASGAQRAWLWVRAGGQAAAALGQVVRAAWRTPQRLGSALQRAQERAAALLSLQGASSTPGRSNTAAAQFAASRLCLADTLAGMHAFGARARVVPVVVEAALRENPSAATAWLAEARAGNVPEAAALRALLGAWSANPMYQGLCRYACGLRRGCHLLVLCQLRLTALLLAAPTSCWELVLTLPQHAISSLQHEAGEHRFIVQMAAAPPSHSPASGALRSSLQKLAPMRWRPTAC